LSEYLGPRWPIEISFVVAVVPICLTRYIRQSGRLSNAGKQECCLKVDLWGTIPVERVQHASDAPSYTQCCEQEIY